MGCMPRFLSKEEKVFFFFLHRLHSLLLDVRNINSIPDDWKDAVLVVLYRYDCGNYRDISLFSV